MADEARLAAFTHRPVLALPDVTTWPPLPDEAVLAGRVVWARRARNEAGSVEVADRLLASTDDAALRAAFARLRDDEARHVDLAGRVLHALGGAPSPAPPLAPLPPGSRAMDLARLVVTGLAVAESVSAARFAAVREHTDAPAAQAAVDVLWRDEVHHAELGFALVPRAVAGLQAEGNDAAAFLDDELRAAFRALDALVGLDAARRGLDLTARPQPRGNPGVVEPAVDAAAFYACVQGLVVPRLAALGVDAARAWEARWADP